MKVKVTEIEATSEDLRQSKTLSEAFSDILRNAFIQPSKVEEDDEDEEDEE